ncbi:MAG: hypothetical protein JWM80_2616 [Cyanobacteria bacterium RYN_339]|nr:hypothetical protein [Cyanobacteria bacterium RYN_339]
MSVSVRPESAAQLVALVALLLTYTPACAKPSSNLPSPTPSADIAPIPGRWYEYNYVVFGKWPQTYRRERYTVLTVTGNTFEVSEEHTASAAMEAKDQAALKDAPLSPPVQYTVKLRAGVFWPFPRPIPRKGPRGKFKNTISSSRGTFPAIEVEMGDWSIAFAGGVVLDGASLQEGIHLQSFGL